ncbi:MAG: hypothetical protein ACQESS_06125 [Bacillota bacterium]
MKRLSWILIVLLFAMIFTSVAVIAQNNVDVSLNFLNGETYFEKEYYYDGNDFIENYNFSTDLIMLDLGWNRKLDNSYLSEFNLNFAFNIDDGAGEMKNVDHFYNNGTKGDVVFDAEADAEDADYKKYDLNIVSKYYGGAGFNYAFKAGYKNTDYKATAVDAHNNLNNTDYSGDFWTYNAEYSMPYLGVKFKNDFKKYGLEGSLNYSPFLGLDLNHKWESTSESITGEGEGDAFMADLKIIYDYNNRVNYYAELNYEKMEVDEDTKIDELDDDLIKAEQEITGLNFGMVYSF